MTFTKEEFNYLHDKIIEKWASVVKKSIEDFSTIDYDNSLNAIIENDLLERGFFKESDKRKTDKKNYGLGVSTWNSLYQNKNKLENGANSVMITDKQLAFFLPFVDINNLNDLNELMNIEYYDTVVYDVLLNKLSGFRIWDKPKLTLYLRKESRTVEKAIIYNFFRDIKIVYEGKVRIKEGYMYIEMTGKNNRDWDKLVIITHLGNYIHWHERPLLSQFIGTSTIRGVASGELILIKQQDASNQEHKQELVFAKRYLNLKRNRVWTKEGVQESAGNLTTKGYSLNDFSHICNKRYYGIIQPDETNILISKLAISETLECTYETFLFRDNENKQFCHIERANKNYFQLIGYEDTGNTKSDILDKDTLNYFILGIPTGKGEVIKGYYTSIASSNYGFLNKAILFIENKSDEEIEPQIIQYDSLYEILPFLKKYKNEIGKIIVECLP